jgi:hypothetical protein
VSDRPEGLCAACSATGPCLEHDPVYRLGDRQVRVILGRDGLARRNHRDRIAVRNVATNRLSYIAEHRLTSREAIESPYAAYQRGVDAERARLLARIRDHNLALARVYNQLPKDSAMREMGRIRVETLDELIAVLLKAEAVSGPSDTPATE